MSFMKANSSRALSIIKANAPRFGPYGGAWRGAAQVTALPHEKGLRLQRLGDADHAFFGDEFGEFFFAHAFRAVGAQGDH